MWHIRCNERPQMTQQSKYAMQDVRRENVRRYVNDNGGPSAVAKRLGHSNGSYLVQMVGPNPSRPVTEKNARAFESMLGLPDGHFDAPLAELPVIVQRPAARPALPATSEGLTSDDLVKLIESVMGACKDEQVDLPTAKFADVLALAVKNAGSHGGQVDQDYVHTLVRLVK